MFDKHQLLAKWREMAELPSPPLEIVCFGHSDFTSSCSEQTIHVVRGAPGDWANEVQFWIRALMAADVCRPDPYFSRYVEGALCAPISKNEFAHVVKEYSRSLVPPLPQYLRELVGWQTGLRMYSEWNDQVVIAELDDAFLLYMWGTSA